MSNRDKIVESAAELFHFFGYDGTSIDMLIKAAGVSKSNLYYYFEGKEELGLEVMETVTALYQKLISETLLKSELHPLKRLALLYRKTIDHQRNKFLKSSKYQGSFFGNMALEQSVKNERFRSAVENHFRECKVSVEACVRECSELGIFYDHLEPKQVTEFLISQFEGAMLMAKVHNSFASIEELFRQAQKVLIKEENLYLLEEFTENS
jgi:TetR/AcrR family transcriptional repressor of nem operon